MKDEAGNSAIERPRVALLHIIDTSRLLEIMKADAKAIFTAAFLQQVFLDLPHIGIALGGRGEDASDVQRLEVGIGLCLPIFNRGEKLEVFDSVIDGSGGEQGIEPACACGRR